jgi:hypothetical protein
MTLKTNARLAGFLFLFYFAVGLGDIYLARHAQLVNVTVVIKRLMFVVAVSLAVALYALTRNEDRDLALIALCCRVSEGMTALLSSANSSSAVGGGGFAFAVGSTLYSYLFLRARSIPVPLAWLGLLGSSLLVVGLPMQLLGLLGGPVTYIMWAPVAVFEVTLGFWLLIKGVATPMKGSES